MALLESTSIEDSSVTRLQGHSDGAFDFAAYFNDAALRAHPVLSALPTTDIRLLYLRGTTRDNACAALTAKQVDYAGDRGADGALMFNVQTLGAAGSPTEWGTQITAGEDTHSSATSSTGVVHAAQTTLGGVGYLQGREVSSGTATVVIEDSSNTTDGTDGSWATLLTFATTSASWPAGERKTVTGNVEKGIRATTTGTFTNADFVVGFKRGVANDREDLS